MAGAVEPVNGVNDLCPQIEACRKLKRELVEEARNHFPFKDPKETGITAAKVSEYRDTITRLLQLCREEERLWGLLH